jgi:hypothetical protein
MTDAEAIAACREGKRVQIECSMHAEENPASALCLHTFWRTIACDSETDVIECAKCGRQRLARCNFDDDFA